MRKQVRTPKIEARRPSHRAGERGSATLVAVLIMSLLFGFVALALSRTSTEAIIQGNDSANTRSFYAAQGSLEVMTRNFAKIFDGRINPSQANLNDLQNNLSVQNAGWQALFPNHTFTQQVFPSNVNDIVTRNVTIAGGPYEGLRAARDTWQFVTTVTGPTGAQVQLTRSFFSNRLPIFQFGVFYEGDMDFWPGPEMYMGGRVHTNGNLFLCGQGGLHFQNRVTAVGEIVHDNARNGGPMYYTDNVWVTNGLGGEIRVTQGSVLGGPNVGGNQPGHFAGTLNANWAAFSAAFNNNLVARAPRLRMPLQLSGSDPVELIRRGAAADNVLVASSRYYNRASIRISLADTQARLPNCAGGGNCGRRLDGDALGMGADAPAGTIRGYVPRPMTGPAYQAARVNGHRLYGANPAWTAAGGGTRQTWIKVELVTPNAANPAAPAVVDVTEDFLSLGLTHWDAFPGNAANTVTTRVGDQWAIIKMQRYRVNGPPLKVADVHNAAASPSIATSLPHSGGGNRPAYSYSLAGGYSYVTTADNALLAGEAGHQAPAAADVFPTGAARRVIPFPVMMYDVREGLYNDDITNGDWDALYRTVAGTPGQPNSNDNVPWRGVVSVIDIDMDNFRRLVDGQFNGRFPNNVLNSASIPRDPQGVILYVSDRRGDVDNDGVYDMENVYVANVNDTSVGAAGLQAGEDLGGAGTGGMTPDGLLQADYTWESARYRDAVPSDLAAIMEQPWPGLPAANMPTGFDLGHRHYRRAVRLINGTTLPGNTNQGVAVATENGAYIQGNYNATGANAPPGGGQPTPFTGFLPYANHPPASVSADAITILSNAWNDGKSFRNPLRLNSLLGNFNGRGINLLDETTVRAALLMGVTRSSLLTNPNQGGGASATGGTLRNSDGGVNNFPRLLEDWGTNGVRLNYLGSMISLFHSRNYNGTFKGHNGSGASVITFLAPSRNWNFDTDFLDPLRNPPGTPFLQYVQVTGFRQTNN